MFVKMSRTNFFAILDSDDESRDGVDTRKQVVTVVCNEKQKRVGQTAALVLGLGDDATRPWGDIALERDGSARAYVYPDPICVRECDLDSDMMEEPWKYGLDIPEAVVAEHNHRAVFGPIAKECAKMGAKRWVARDIRGHVLKIKTAVITIQAAVRGYQARCKDSHLDCCMCLSHRFSPLKTQVGYMCRECAEIGPHTEIVEEDPWNWHRTDFVDEAAPKYDTCNWCNQDFLAPLWNGEYCSYECEHSDRTA